MGWHCVPSGRVPALQVWGPEFKHHTPHQKKKKKRKGSHQNKKKYLQIISVWWQVTCT
jgi:hypothetical protein